MQLVTKGRTSALPAPAAWASAAAIAGTAGLTLQILATHRLTGRPTPVSLALTWAMSTTGAWVLAALTALILAGVAVRIRPLVPRLTVLFLLAIVCVVTAVTVRALVDPMLPSMGQQGVTGLELWYRYLVRWNGPGMLAALALVSIPLWRNRLRAEVAPLVPEPPSEDAASPTDAPLETVVVRVGDRSIPVDLTEVQWIGAAGNYAELHVRTGRHVARITMADLERRLDPARFVRVHRSTIVALPSIRAVRPRPNGGAEVVLVDGAVVPLSRVGRKALEARMGARG